MNDAACAGQWALFDSTDQADHRESKKLCRDCPLFHNRECLDRLSTAQRAGLHGGPQGTWAGMLVGDRTVALKGDCPACGAVDGDPCVTGKGRPHAARLHGLPRCRTCNVEFTATRGHYRYCSDACSEAAVRERKRRDYQNRSNWTLDKKCVDCGGLTGGSRCVRCNAVMASRVSHGREVA